MRPGDTIDVWVVEAALGSGGMGSVYRCHNRSATRILAAVKVLDGGLRAHREAEQRFVREADILGQLDHRNIVKVRNVRHEHDPPYLEMEFVAGESLDARMQRGAMRYEDALGVLRQCADALAYMHPLSVRHRDLKPANILITTDGTVKLVDFGLAVEVDRSRITQEGMAFGTVSYAPPEWIKPDSMDPVKWDLYALGVIVWEALTGLVAFPISGHGSARQQALQVMMAKQNHAPLDPGPEFPEPIRSVVRDLTQADPTRRIGDARIVVERAAAIPDHMRPGGANVTLAPSAMDLVERPGLDSDPSHPTGPVPSTTPPMAASRAALQTLPLSSPGPSKRRLALAAFGGVGLATLVGTVVLGCAAAVAFVWVATAARPVVVQVRGAEGAPIEVRVAGADGLALGDDRFEFGRIRAGQAEVRWISGIDCRAGDGGTPPSWCTAGDVAVRVPRGIGAFGVEVPVTPPSPRDVVLALAGPDAGTPVIARLGAVDARRAVDHLEFSAVPPGVHVLSLTAGACPEGTPPCWPEGVCPPGCVTGERSVEVPLAGPTVPDTLAVALVPVAVETPEPAAPVATPSTAPRPRSGWATVGMLSNFVQANPTWGPDTPRAKAGGSGYLRGWTASGPPAGTSPDAPATGVTGELARKVCQASGMDLADVSDLSDATDLELRREGEVVRLVERQEGAEASLVPLANLAVSHARWRCRR